MIYKQQSHLPIIFQVDEGIITEINQFLKRNKLLFSEVLVVSGKSISKQYADQISQAERWKTYILKDNTFEEVEALKNFITKQGCDLIVAVGGGKVIDTVKRVSYLSNINTLVVPTIISNDGLISPVAVIKNESGKTESIPGQMPMGVVIDLNIIKESPAEYIQAASGDILSNISATNDWILALKNGGERMNDIAFHLSKSAANSLVHYDHVVLKDKQFLRLVVQGLINSGIAMSLAGTSRPCSGSEHLISHALDFMSLSNKLHGTQVASVSLFTLFLQGKFKEKHLRFAKAIQIPLDFTEEIEDFSKNLFFELLNKAREMRPGRYTVLAEVENELIFSKLKDFKKEIAVMN